jgi:ADP-ribose pyrophosphatase YjhB (NUDIX family)
MADKLYEFILKVHAISKIGLLYSKDSYAIENYQELQLLSKSILEEFGDLKINGPSFFARDVYPTPNISVRAIITNDKNQILLVKEAALGTWSLPGGWCDLFETPAEAIYKEVLQEAGMKVKITKLLGINDRTKFKTKNVWSEYAIIFAAEIIEDTKKFGHEVTAVQFFEIDQLPELSFKTTHQEILRALAAHHDNKAYFD